MDNRFLIHRIKLRKISSFFLYVFKNPLINKYSITHKKHYIYQAEQKHHQPIIFESKRKLPCE